MSVYFEIYNDNKIAVRSNEILSELSFTNSLMDEATTSLTIPAKYIRYISGSNDIKIHCNDVVFYGIITSHSITGNVLELEITHKIHEWNYRQISVNNAVKDKSLEFVYVENAENLIYNDDNEEAIASNTLKITQEQKDKGLTSDELVELTKTRAWSTSAEYTNLFLGVNGEIKTIQEDGKDKEVVRFWTGKGTEVFVNISIIDKQNEDDDTDPRVVAELDDIMNNINFAYPGWNVIYKDNANKRVIDYVYSRMSKLEALTKTCELTEDLYWRTTLDGELNVEIGTFGELRNVVFSTLPAGTQNIQILDTPQVHYEYNDACNLLSVYGDKSDSGASSLTLREVYMNPALQDSNFPVRIIRTALTANVNNERNYEEYYEQYPALAPNNDTEYAIIDNEGVALQAGKLIEQSKGFNDVAPFNVDHGEGRTLVITDADRIKAAQTIYKAGIKWLKNNRQSVKISFNCTKVPKDLLPGDMVHFRYGYDLFCDIALTNYWKKLLKSDKWYVEEITRNYNGDLETAEVVLSKFLQITREVERNG